MKCIASFHPEAQQELIAIAVWYDGRREGLGDEFVDAVSAKVVDICRAQNDFQSYMTMYAKRFFGVFRMWSISVWPANEFSWFPFFTLTAILNRFGRDLDP